MPLDTAPKLRRKCNVAFALEMDTGVPAALAAADGVTPAYNASVRFQTEAVERESQGTSISPVRQDLGARAADAEFEVDMIGSLGLGQPVWARLLRSAGMVPTGSVYKPITDATETITVGVWRSGRLYRLSGGMSTFTMNFRRGQKARMRVQVRGVQQPVTDVAHIAPAYVNTVAPRVGAATLTVGGTTLRVPEVEIEKGNILTLREDIAAVDEAGEPTGYRAAMITGWQTIVRMSPESLPLATKDWFDIYRDNVLSALVLEIGTVDGNKFPIACPKLQLITDPQYEDRDGLMADTLEFLAVRGLDAGDDDLTIDVDQTGA